MADKSTVENVLELFKGMGIDPLGFERAQKSAEAFNDTLINLERTGLTFGKSVERIRDEINKLAFAFNINQKEIVPIYKELHRFKGIKLTDFKEMISILELARDTFGPDEAQLLVGVKFQQQMMKNGSAFQGIFMKIAQLKMKVMSGDESAVIQLKQEAMKLKSIARVNLSLGETISGIGADEIEGLLSFAESQLTTNPLGEKARAYNERQMRIRNLGLSKQLMIDQMDAEIGGATSGLQSIQEFILSYGVAFADEIIDLYSRASPDTIVTKIATAIDKALKKDIDEIDVLLRNNSTENRNILVMKVKEKLNALKDQLVKNSITGLTKKYKTQNKSKNAAEIEFEANSTVDSAFQQSKYAKMVNNYKV